MSISFLCRRLFFLLVSIWIHVYFFLCEFSARLLFTSIVSAVKLPSPRVHILSFKEYSISKKKRKEEPTRAHRAAKMSIDMIVPVCGTDVFFRALKAIYIFLSTHSEYFEFRNVVCQISEIGFRAIHNTLHMQESKAVLFAGCIIDKLWNPLYGFRNTTQYKMYTIEKLNSMSCAFFSHRYYSFVLICAFQAAVHIFKSFSNRTNFTTVVKNLLDLFSLFETACSNFTTPKKKR